MKIIPILLFIGIIVLVQGDDEIEHFIMCCAGEGHGCLSVSARFMERSGGTAPTVIFTHRQHVKDQGGVMSNQNPISRNTHLLLSKYYESSSYHISTNVDDDLGLIQTMRIYHETMYPNVTFGSYNTNPHILFLNDGSSINLMQGMTFILLPTGMAKRRTLGSNEEACFSYSSATDYGNVYINAETVPAGECTQNIHFNTDAISGAMETMLPNLREKIRDARKRSGTLSMQSDNPSEDPRRAIWNEMENGYIAFPIFNVILQLMNMYPEEMPGLMGWSVNFVIQMTTFPPPPPYLSITQTLNMFFPDPENYPNRMMIHNVLAMPSLHSDYVEEFPFVFGMGVDYFMYVYYTDYLYIRGGSKTIIGHQRDKFKERGGVIRYNHEIIEFILDEENSDPSTNTFKFSGVRAKICPPGNDEASCVIKDFSCDYIATAAGAYQNYKVLMPQVVQEAFGYDEMFEGRRGTQPYIKYIMYFDKPCQSFLTKNTYHVINSDEYYPHKLKEYIDLPGNVAKDVIAPYYFFVSSHGEEFHEKSPDTCIIRGYGIANTKEWDPWFAVKAEDRNMDLEFNKKKKKYKDQFATKICSMFPGVNCVTDIVYNHIITPPESEDNLKRGFDSAGNLIGCAGLSKSDIYNPVLEHPSGFHVKGTDIFQVGNEGPWGASTETVFSVGNRASHVMCTLEYLKNNPAFGCDMSIPRYPDCTDCV